MFELFQIKNGDWDKEPAGVGAGGCSVGKDKKKHLGPLLFSLALHSVVKTISSEFPNLDINCWYLDDGILIGTEEDIAKVLDRLRELCPSVGLELNLGKFELRWPGANAEIACSATLFPADILRSGANITELLGAPIGYHPDADKYVGKRVSKISSNLSNLNLLNDFQCQMLLLKKCLALTKFGFALRVTPPELIPTAFDQAIFEQFCILLGHIPKADTRCRMGLSVKWGGCGIPLASDLALPAYLVLFSISLQAEVIGPTIIKNEAEGLGIIIADLLTFAWRKSWKAR
jgi:hypothetical protein